MSTPNPPGSGICTNCQVFPAIEHGREERANGSIVIEWHLCRGCYAQAWPSKGSALPTPPDEAGQIARTRVNPLPCGCEATTGATPYQMHVRFCSLHAAAQEMLEALKRLVAWDDDKPLSYIAFAGIREQARALIPGGGGVTKTGGSGGESVKHYPLDIVQIPDSGSYYSKGHHPHQDFLRALVAGWDARPYKYPSGQLAEVFWVHWRVDPPQSKEERTVQTAMPGTRGAFPVTVIYETEGKNE